MEIHFPLLLISFFSLSGPAAAAAAVALFLALILEDDRTEDDFVEPVLARDEGLSPSPSSAEFSLVVVVFWREELLMPGEEVRVDVPWEGRRDLLLPGE